MELIKGTLDMLVLRALAARSMHGYGVAEWIRQRTADAVLVQDAALYQALRRLGSRALVESAWGVSESRRRARYYRLTSSGHRKLREEAARWRGYTDAGMRVLDPLHLER